MVMMGASERAGGRGGPAGARAGAVGPVSGLGLAGAGLRARGAGVRARAEAKNQVVKPMNGDPFIGMLETPVTSSPIVAKYLSNLPAYRTGVSVVTRGVEIGAQRAPPPPPPPPPP